MKETTDRLWIVLTGYIATEMTDSYLSSHREELESRFSIKMLRECEALSHKLKAKESCKVLSDFESAYAGELSETGVFGGLWEMAEKLDVGLTVDRLAIPIRQEIIEVAEYFDTDPYRAPSRGNLLIASRVGHEIVEALNDAGIVAAVIGHTTDTRDRVVVTHDRTTYLTPA